MNTFIQWQETISDAYLTYTPSYFPFIEPNTSLLPQASLASIPSNALIFISFSLLKNSKSGGDERNHRSFDKSGVTGYGFARRNVNMSAI